MKLMLVYIKGDMIVLLPLLVLILLTGFISLKFMTILLGSYIAIRQFGEMMYWFHHQFGSRQYRPHDFGFKHLDNHAMYILYQTLATAGLMFGIAIMVGAIMFMQ
jgi:hypothetical protein